MTTNFESHNTKINAQSWARTLQVEAAVSIEMAKLPSSNTIIFLYVGRTPTLKRVQRKSSIGT
jgi:hypothetical protein